MIMAHTQAMQVKMEKKKDLEYIKIQLEIFIKENGILIIYMANPSVHGQMAPFIGGR